MTGFADIHTHLLPGADDGAKDMDAAMALVQRAYESGTRVLVLTPHYRANYRCNTPQQLQSVFAQLCSAVQARFADVKLYLAQEIYYDAQAAEALAEGRALGIHDSGYAMIEFSPKSTQAQIQKGVDDFMYYGYRPVIAHAERYQVLRRDKALLDYVLSRGALLQLNADSVLGSRGFAAARFCRRMLKEGKASFIASDAHDLHKRPPVLQKCFAYVNQKYGEGYAHVLFYDNPVAMLSGEGV